MPTRKMIVMETSRHQQATATAKKYVHKRSSCNVVVKKISGKKKEERRKERREGRRTERRKERRKEKGRKGNKRKEEKEKEINDRKEK